MNTKVIEKFNWIRHLVDTYKISDCDISKHLGHCVLEYNFDFSEKDRVGLYITDLDILGNTVAVLFEYIDVKKNRIDETDAWICDSKVFFHIFKYLDGVVKCNQ